MPSHLIYLVAGVFFGVVASWLTTRAGLSRPKIAVEKTARQTELEFQQNLALQETAAFRALFEASFGGVATLDDQGRVLTSNRNFEARLGYSEAELKGRSLTSIVHPEDGEPIRSFLASLVGAGKRAQSATFAEELRCYSKSGEPLWTNLALSVLPYADEGEPSPPPVLLAQIDDVTRRHQAETAAARLSTGVHDLYQVVANQQLNLEEQMKALLSLGCRLFDISSGFLVKVTDEHLKIRAVVSPDERIRAGNSYETSNTLASAHLRMLAAHISGEAGRDWRSHPFVAVTEGETFLGAPIYIAGRFYGVLFFSDTESRSSPFQPEQTQFCQLMALWIGSEIERRKRQAYRAREEAALIQAKNKLEAIATEDALTGLKNRRAFDEKLQSEFVRARDGKQPLSLLLLDVDKFKQFNDSFGHPAGDDVLRKVGRILQNSVRDGVFVARYGGEEFVVLLSNTAEAAAFTAAERLRSNIESATWAHRPITASFGLAVWTSDMTTGAQLTSAADGALYQSKSNGRNRVTIAGHDNEAAT